jgi:short-subunit dehydrogenase
VKRLPETPRTLVVTGASSGIGRAVAELAAARGFRVLIVARRTQRLDEVSNAIRKLGGSCVALAGDVTANDMPARIVAAAMREFGRIDVVVNNAGAGAYGLLLEQNDAEIESQWQLNVAAPLRIARAALPQLKATHGQIVFMGSGVTRVPLPSGGAYASAKAAIRAAAVQLRRELRRDGIAVTYVDPGVVTSEFHSNVGIERNPGLATSPQHAARAIMRGIARRSAVVNAVPWQTAFTVLAEWLGPLADPIVIRRFGARRLRHEAATRSPVILSPSTALRTSSVEGRQSGDLVSFTAALEPVARRMERVKLPESFLREALVRGTQLELNALAMRWAGMPNKNERAALREALDALTAGGYLEPLEEETWKVVRAAD